MEQLVVVAAVSLSALVVLARARRRWARPSVDQVAWPTAAAADGRGVCGEGCASCTCATSTSVQGRAQGSEGHGAYK